MFRNRTASHDIARHRTTGYEECRIFASWFRKRWKITFLTGKIFFSNWEAEIQTKIRQTRLQALLRVLRISYRKSPARDEAKRGQNAYEPKHESIHQVSHRGRVLCRRHIPLQLVYCGARDRKEPATTSGEQHLHSGRFFPFRSDHYHPVKADKWEMTNEKWQMRKTIKWEMRNEKWERSVRAKAW